MAKGKYYKLHETFEYNGVTLEVQKVSDSNECGNCFFSKHTCMGRGIVICTAMQRKDKTSVKFVKVKQE